MPANGVLINGTLEYAVSDSKMGKLMEWLNNNGTKIRDISHEPEEDWEGD